MKFDLLDSSGWIECLQNGPNTAHFGPILRKLPNLIVPAITITEVRKIVLSKRTRQQADAVTRAMSSGIVVPIDEKIAAHAADLSKQYKLPLADSLIYAVALARKATVWTQDADFKGLPDVHYFPKIQP